MRVLVTGLGSVSAAGVGGRLAVERVLAGGESAIRPVRGFDVGGWPSRLGAEVDDGLVEPLLDPEAARRLSRICRLTVAACRLAQEDAAVEGGADLAIVLGTEHGDFRSSGAFADGYLRRGVGGLSPMIFPNTVMNAMAGAAAIALGARGPTVTLNQATVAGDLAVARAAALVAGGRARVALAGGVDELCGPVYRQLAEMGALSPMRRSGAEGCRPYAADHNGPVLGEGATFLVLETEDHAAARGARVLGEIRGAAWNNIPVAPHSAPVRRRDPHSPVSEVLGRLGLAAGALAGTWGAGNGDPAVDDWEQVLLAEDLGPAVATARSLAQVFGQHGGLGALRVAAAAREAQTVGAPVLAHGIARGGCRTALVVGPA